MDRFSGGPYYNPNGEDSANNSRDTPTLTYVALDSNRIFLVSTTVTAPEGNPVLVYSYIEGPANAPLYYPVLRAVAVNTLITGSQGALIPAVDAPGCTTCMQAWTNAWVHSAGVFGTTHTNPYVVSTSVWGQGDNPTQTQTVSQAFYAYTGARRTLVLKGRPMAAEIAMPLVLPGYNQALIVFDVSRPNFYPGVRSVTWDIDAPEPNSIVAVDTLQQGSFTPSSSFNRTRWTDFISAITPIPNSSSFVVGATLAAPSSVQPERTTYWATVTP